MPINFSTECIKEYTAVTPRAYLPFQLAVKSSQPLLLQVTECQQLANMIYPQVGHLCGIMIYSCPTIGAANILHFPQLPNFYGENIFSRHSRCFFSGICFSSGAFNGEACRVDTLILVLINDLCQKADVFWQRDSLSKYLLFYFSVMFSMMAFTSGSSMEMAYTEMSIRPFSVSLV